MPDEMFFSKDERSLTRGKRVTKRTDTCRPCMVRIGRGNAAETEGVVMDISPYGMLVRTLDPIPMGSNVSIQLMRDDAFKRPFSQPHQGKIVRQDPIRGGFYDHGVKLKVEKIGYQESPPVTSVNRPNFQRKRSIPRMHTLDITIGGLPKGPTKR